MIIHEKSINEKIIINTLPNGLKCYIIPKENYVEKQAAIVVNYGSAHSRFNVDGTQHDTPLGIAHFLEHKLFEGKAGNAFDQFVNFGADVNAFTNYTNTAYYFNCNHNFEDNFKVLLSFTQEPFFTEENVEKEKGIIKQEIKMYDDNPFWRSYLNMQLGLYREKPIRNDIAGTQESIDQINKDTLYTCYHSFYVPQNMAIICAGSVPDTVMKLAEEFWDKKSGSLPNTDFGNEPEDSDPYMEDQMQVSMPMFNLGFKENDLGRDVLTRMTSQKIVLDYLFGLSSEFYQENYSKGLLDDSFSFEYSCSGFYGTVIFSGSSKEPKALLEAIQKQIDRARKDGLNENRVSVIRKKHIGRFIRGFNYIGGIVNGQIDMFSKGLTIFDVLQKYNSISDQEIFDGLSLYGNKNFTLSVVNKL